MIIESDKLFEYILTSRFFNFFVEKLKRNFYEFGSKDIGKNENILTLKEITDDFLSILMKLSFKDNLIEYEITEKLICLLCLFLNFPEKDINKNAIVIMKNFSHSFLKYKNDKSFTNFFVSFNNHLKENEIFLNLIQLNYFDNLSILLTILKLIKNLSLLFIDFICLENSDDLILIFESVLFENKKSLKEEITQEMISILINISNSSKKCKQKIFDSKFLKLIIEVENKFLKNQTINLFFELISILTKNISFGNSQTLIKLNFFELCIKNIEITNFNSNTIIYILNSLIDIFDSCIFMKSLNSNNTNVFLKIFSEKGGKKALEKLCNSSNQEIYGKVNMILNELEDFDF